MIIRGRHADEAHAVAGPAEIDPGEPAISKPMMARDGSDFGRIEVSGKAGGFNAADELALEDLARHAALALENVRLEERERHIARTLQASLLPPRLPAIEGLEAAARHFAGGEGTLVGGDVYDLFPVLDEWTFFVGDVCGKGAEAAALTAMVRYTLRAEAIHRARPRDVLGRVNEAILRQFDDGRFCTVLHGRVRIEAGEARLRLASAGHPPPFILRAEGTIEAVEVGGPLLGVVPEVTHRDVHVTLAPGDALVCFTDGVTEGRGPQGMFGDQALVPTLEACAGLDAEAIAERVTRAALDFQGGQTQDDLALLVLRVHRAPRIASAWQDGDWRAWSASSGVNALFSTAYGNVGSSIYYALGLVASFALGLTPVVFIITGVLLLLHGGDIRRGDDDVPRGGRLVELLRRAFNEFLSFFAAWAQMLNYVVTIAISAFFVPHYLGGLFWELLRSLARRHHLRLPA